MFHHVIRWNVKIPRLWTYFPATDSGQRPGVSHAPGLFMFGRLFTYSTPCATEPPQVQCGDNASVHVWSPVPLATTVNAGVLRYNSVGMVGTLVPRRRETRPYHGDLGVSVAYFFLSSFATVPFCHIPSPESVGTLSAWSSAAICARLIRLLAVRRLDYCGPQGPWTSPEACGLCRHMSSDCCSGGGAAPSRVRCRGRLRVTPWSWPCGAIPCRHPQRGLQIPWMCTARLSGARLP